MVFLIFFMTISASSYFTAPVDYVGLSYHYLDFENTIMTYHRYFEAAGIFYTATFCSYFCFDILYGFIRCSCFGSCLGLGLVYFTVHSYVAPTLNKLIIILVLSSFTTEKISRKFLPESKLEQLALGFENLSLYSVSGSSQQCRCLYHFSPGLDSYFFHVLLCFICDISQCTSYNWNDIDFSEAS